MSASRLFHARRASAGLAMLVAVCTGCVDTREGRRTSNAGNQAPLGVIEEPREGPIASVAFRVAGWAGDDRGIRAVRVFIDGQLIGLAGFAWSRPDVTKVYPALRHGTDRLGYEANVEALPPGVHVVRVELVDSDGVTSDLGTRQITVSAR